MRWFGPFLSESEDPRRRLDEIALTAFFENLLVLIIIRLRVKQKEAIRVINNAGYRDRTARLFKLNNILPLDALITFSKLKFMHNYVHHKLPLSFNEMWTYNVNPPPHSIEQSLQVFVMNVS
jgi:hypothetical protein